MQPRKPSWNSLYELAAGQGGYFRTEQALELGFSSQLLRSHVIGGALQRAQRGIYRITRFPIVPHEDMVAIWLWSRAEGVFSHESALALHEISDALPAAYHLTVPRAWRKRRRAAPRGVILYFADVPAEDRTWVGLVPVTTPIRTLRDLVEDGASSELIRQAAADGLARRFFRRQDLHGIVPARRGRPRGARTVPNRRRRAP